MDHNNILGTVLAGGKSQRFGEDKSQVKLAGKLLIDHILTEIIDEFKELLICLLYTSPSPRDVEESRMPSSA